MAYVAADGPPDIDATHAWAPATGTAPPVLNDQARGATGPATLPWVRIASIDGWRDLPEIDDRRAPKTVGDGEIDYPSRTLGKTVVYVCQVRGQTKEQTRGRLSAIIAGYGLSLSAKGTMTVTPYAAVGGPAWTFQARTLAIDSDSAWTYVAGGWGPYRWGFTLSLRMSDPRFYTGGVGYL